MIQEKRLEMVNHVLDLLGKSPRHPGPYKFSLGKNNRLYLETGTPRRTKDGKLSGYTKALVRLDTKQARLIEPRGPGWPFGGTTNAAIFQLVCWLKDLPRLPLATWEYWAGPRVNLCGQDVLETLKATGYVNPDGLKCVLCGALIENGLDWWGSDKVSGPCHLYNRCVSDDYLLSLFKPEKPKYVY